MAADQEGEHRHVEAGGEPQDHGHEDDDDHNVAVPPQVHGYRFQVSLRAVAFQLRVYGPDEHGHDLVRQEDGDDDLHEEGHEEGAREAEAEDRHAELFLHRVQLEDLGEVFDRAQVLYEGSVEVLRHQPGRQLLADLW